MGRKDNPSTPPKLPTSSGAALRPRYGTWREYAIAAADNAEAAYEHDEVAAFLRIALDLIPRTIRNGRDCWRA